MFLQIQKKHKSNGKELITICNYGYFLPKGKWEAIHINIPIIKYCLWIWRKRKYRNEWPACCG